MERSRRGMGVSLKAGIDVLERFDLATEAPTSLDNSVIGLALPRVTSAHAPFGKDDMRLNIAAVDDDFRDMSIAIISDYITAAFTGLPGVRTVVTHLAPKRWTKPAQKGGNEGDYDRLIDALRRLGVAASDEGLQLAIENNRTYWDGIDDDVPGEEADTEALDQYFGSAPDEWIGICQDVGLDNVRLCLDTSHATTWAQTLPLGQEREEGMTRFLRRPERIGHVHWNGNYLGDPRGRADSHLGVGADTIPAEFHRKIAALEATKLLEHWHGVDGLVAELAFIDSL